MFHPLGVSHQVRRRDKKKDDKEEQKHQQKMTSKEAGLIPEIGEQIQAKEKSHMPASLKVTSEATSTIHQGVSSEVSSINQVSSQGRSK